MIARRNDYVIFLVVAFGLAWLVGSGPWIDGEGLSSFMWLNTGAALMMVTPALGVLAVWRYRRLSFAQLVDDTGLRLGDRPSQTLWLMVAAWFGVPAFVWLAYGASAALGLWDFDFLSAELMSAVLIESLTTSILALIVLALGEEVGWRGWLQPQLMGRFGLVGGLVATGVIWALWHAPLTLLGRNYPNLGAWAAVAFIGFCVTFGAVLGWLRMRSGSVWPCVVAHAALNASAVAASVTSATDTDEEPNPLLAGHGGIVGWTLAAFIAFLLFTWLRPTTTVAAAPDPAVIDSAAMDPAVAAPVATEPAQ